ncbi:MAG: tRNA (N6-threonylcarbamoyladenosine(37)-N6)-methyltransferase TrmO [Candidatus Spechtbacterales bacterium]|nr:tRNA (N6-threonylcarbamoyladenosine(37)-N6)-methyltransferase TrmO [Candidatus Spechtbacterales bacterium]
MNIKPIGRVDNGVYKRTDEHDWDSIISTIIVDSELEEALDGIEEYSHIVVLFWLDRAKQDDLLKVKVPYGPKDLNPQGVFATRIPQRPNPIGVSTVELLSRAANMLHVIGLDAFHGTPVLDIKPYTGYKREFVLNFHVPEWAQYLAQEGREAAQ